MKMERTQEPKRAGTAELEPKIEATNCPQRSQHQSRLGQVCGGCGELVPPGGAYTPAQFDRYFRMGPDMAESPWAELCKEDNEKIAQGWREYDALNRDYQDAVFDVENLKTAASQTDVRTDSWGGQEPIQATRDRARQKRAAIPAAEKRREDLRDECHEKLVEINRLTEIKTWKIQRAMLAESFPPDDRRSVLERASAALRGAT
jgi:hypothetical protein